MKPAYILGGSGGGADASVSQVSVELEAGDNPAYSIQTTFAGASGGTLTLECSNDNVTWITVNGSSTVIAASSPNVMYDVPRFGYRFARTRWASTGGVGTIACFAVVKEVPFPRG